MRSAMWNAGGTYWRTWIPPCNLGAQPPVDHARVRWYVGIMAAMNGHEYAGEKQVGRG